MPSIIRVIASTFSERNAPSWTGAERNAVEQISAIYSAKDGASVGSADKAVAVAIRAADIPAKEIE
jgi:uncharacterized protein YoaH (UPF0181 family)